MKKLTIFIAAIALVCFAVPAMAADWNFYGSARMATFYISDDYGDGTNAAGTDDSDAELQWEFQGNSRLGARVKAESVSGRIELANTSDNTHDGGVFTRLLYGDWDFGAGKLRVGKAYTPTSQFISGQVFGADLGMLGVGTNYGRRVPGLQLMFGKFTVALLEANDSNAGGWSTYADGDSDRFLPKLEAGWGMAFDTWNFNLMGGLQYVEVEDMPSAVDPGDSDDVDVTSYILGADAGVNFGPAYVKTAFSFGQNWTNARWSDLAYSRSGASSGAGLFDGDDDVDDSDNYQVALVGGMKVSDMLQFEAGAGYRVADSDQDAVRKAEVWNVYGQAVIAMAPGVYVIPEAGYFDFGNDTAGDDQGKEFYLGAKWQIDF